MAAKTFLAAFLQSKCPQCRHGNIFTYPVTRLSKFNEMNEVCPYCGVRLSPEPGFYQGAMYISYGFTIMFLMIISALLYAVFNPPEWIYIASIIGVMVLIAPFNYRYSRVLYLYFFGGIRYSSKVL